MRRLAKRGKNQRRIKLIARQPPDQLLFTLWLKWHPVPYILPDSAPGNHLIHPGQHPCRSSACRTCQQRDSSPRRRLFDRPQSRSQHHHIPHIIHTHRQNIPGRQPFIHPATSSLPVPTRFITPFVGTRFSASASAPFTSTPRSNATSCDKFGGFSCGSYRGDKSDALKRVPTTFVAFSAFWGCFSCGSYRGDKSDALKRVPTTFVAFSAFWGCFSCGSYRGDKSDALKRVPTDCGEA